MFPMNTLTEFFEVLQFVAPLHIWASIILPEHCPAGVQFSRGRDENEYRCNDWPNRDC